MDRSIEYSQVMSNYNSAYNAMPTLVYQPTIFIPARSSSPNSIRSTSPSFNFDLYNSNDYHPGSIDYPSPSSSVIIHHHPVYSSPPPSPPPPSQAVSKLRQINDEICRTLAQCEISNQPPSPPPPPNHHVHHYPISRDTYRSPSSNERDSSVESEPVQKKRNARLTYKVHIPRQRKSSSNIDQLLISTSDAYKNDPMTIDLYPTHDDGFIRRIRNRPDNQRPWLPEYSPGRRNSYSESSTFRTPRTPDYQKKPIQIKSRLYKGGEYPPPRSSSAKSRIRPVSASNPVRQSAYRYTPPWQPNGSIRPPQFIGSHAPPTKSKHGSEPKWNPAGPAKTKPFRAFDPTTKPSMKSDELIWNPTSKSIHEKSVKYFEPTLKPTTKSDELIWNPTSKSIPEERVKYFEPTLKPELFEKYERETAPKLGTKKFNSLIKIRHGDPKLKSRIAKAESIVKSAWEPTTNDQPVKSTVPRPSTIKTTTIVPKTKVKIVPTKKVPPRSTKSIKTDTGRSSLKDLPTKPMYQSTPMEQSINEEYDKDVGGYFDDDSAATVRRKDQEIFHSSPQIEKTPQKIPSSSLPKIEREKKPMIIHDESVIEEENNQMSPNLSAVNNNKNEEHFMNNRSFQPSTNVSKPPESSPKPNEESIATNDDVTLPENLQQYESDDNGFEKDQATDAEDEINDDQSKGPIVIPSAKVDSQTSIHDEESLHLPEKEQSKPPTIGKDDDLADFFD